MANDKIVIDFTIDDEQADKTLKEFESKAKKSGDKSGDSFSKSFGQSIKQGLSKASSSFKNFRNSSRNALKQNQAFNNSLQSTRGIALKLGTALAAVFGGRAILQAAQTQQDAVKGLEVSLGRIGEFSAQASQGLQDYAAGIEQTLGVGDELVLQQLTIAQGFGATAEQSKEVVNAALDLSAALGTDFESAVRQVSKSFGGYAGELGEILPSLKELTQDQLRAGEAARLISEQFGGTALGQVNTFSGAVKGLGASFGTLLENLGAAVTNSPEFTAIITQLRSFVDLLAQDAGNIVQGLGRAVITALSFVSQQLIRTEVQVRSFFNSLTSQESYGPAVELLQTFAEIVNATVGKAFVIAKNLAMVAFQAIRSGVATIAIALGSLGESLGELGRRFFGFGEEATEVFTRLKEFGQADQGNAFESLKNSADALFDGETIANAQNFTELLQEQFNAINSATLDEETGQSKLAKYLEPFSEENLQATLDRVSAFNSTVATGVKKTAGEASKAGKEIQVNFGQLITNVVVSAAASLGQALAGAGDGFKGFAKAALSIVGDFSIQLGKQLIAAGIGIDALKKSLTAFGGGFAIAAGIALVALGNVLKSFGGGAGGLAGGGGGATASGGDGLAGGASPSIAATEATEPAEREEQGARVVVNVEGNVLSSSADDLGTRLTEILQSSFDTNNAQVVTG